MFGGVDGPRAKAWEIVPILLREPTALVITVCALLIVYVLRTFLVSSEEKAVEYSLDPPAQTQPGWQGKTLENPVIKTPGSTAIQCYAPATGQLLGLINPTTPDGIDRVIAKAADAQRRWSETSFRQRRRVLRTLLKFVLNNQETIARTACLDSGKTRVDAVFGEILVTAEKLKWTIDHGEGALKPQQRPTNFLMFYKHNEVRYEPMGVVGACVSWNYPFHNFMGPVISAIFCGNGIVVKSSEQTAWSTAYFVRIVRSALEACGHDQNLVQAVSCWPETAAHFTSHPRINHLTFIGSKPVAHEVARCAARSLTPLCVELGGKDAAIVLDDPSGRPERPREIARVVSTLMRGVFQSAGQNCIGIERIVAMPMAYTSLLSLLKERIAKLRLGSDLDGRSDDAGVDVGAMISSASFDRLERLIEEAVEQGANLVLGGRRYHHPQYASGHYFSPTLLVDVTPSMRIAQEELFAPVCVLMKANSVSEAVTIANGTSYGLGSNVFGPTSSAAARRNLELVTRDLRAGMVAVNDFAVTYAVQLPFGGVRGSGYGRFAGNEGLQSLCNLKSVCVDRWPSWIKTSIPSKLDYPMQASAWEMGRGVVEVGYGDSLRKRISGIKKML